MPPVFHFTPPSAPLRGLIREHQIVRLRFGAEGGVPVKPYWPRPGCWLAFYPRDREHVSSPLQTQARKPRAVLIGQPSVVTWRQGGPNFSVYQIEFEPGVLHRLTGLPAHALLDRYVDAEAVFPADFRRLVDRVEDSETPGRMIAAAETYILARAQATRRRLDAVDRLAGRLLRNPALNLDRLAAEAGLSARQLRRLFEERLGASPKFIARVSRFHQLMLARNRDPGADWLSLAIEAGYYDHQHMARDFRDFTRMGPTAFTALERASPERAFGFVDSSAGD